jgi:hypothetical protein
MSNEFDLSKAYRPLMAGVFAGIIALFLNLVFDIYYRDITRFPLSQIINVASIIFGTLLLMTLAGVAFAVMSLYIKHVTIPYMIVSISLTLLCIRFAMHVHRAADPVLTAEFRGLLTGIFIISGIFASFLVPYLAKKDNMFI